MNEESTSPCISSDEKDILQEIMNIAFGKAAADLAEVINIFVVLSVPYIKLLPSTEMADHIRSEVQDYRSVSIVEQNFWGKFKGSALLVFSAGAGKELISLLNTGHETASDPGTCDILEKETLMEVGNILIGACVGKVAHLLGEVVTYSPPRVIIENHPSEIIPKDLFSGHYSAIVLKTVFCFKERKVNGFLFLLTSHESIEWLKTALNAFMEKYE